MEKSLQETWVHEGRMEGFDEGVREGFRIGNKAGKEAGALDAAIRHTKALLEKGINWQVITEVTGLTAENLRIFRMEDEYLERLRVTGELCRG